eukprot:SAG31_NODE_4274_length_3387_cov_41.794708_3_plen_238_part_01
MPERQTWRSRVRFTFAANMDDAMALSRETMGASDANDTSQKAKKGPMTWELTTITRTVAWIWNRIDEIIKGTGDGTCKMPYQDGQGLLYHYLEARWDRLMDAALWHTLPHGHGMLVRDYAHLFKWNPSGMLQTQEMYRTPRTSSLMTNCLAWHNENYVEGSKIRSEKMYIEEEVCVFCDAKDQGADCAAAGINRVEREVRDRACVVAWHAKADNKMCEWKSRFTTQDFRLRCKNLGQW